MTTRVRLDIHVSSPATGVVHAAECVIEEEAAGIAGRVDFRYTPAYLEHPGAFALDPSALPLAAGEARLRCQGGVPGFIDDYLPDAWGRRVLAALALYRDGRRLNVGSAIELLALAGNGSRIGALSFVGRGQEAHYAVGAPLELLARTEEAAVRIDSFDSARLDELALAHLAEAGSGTGGARPKALVTDGAHHYLAKFNRLRRDDYNSARVELACLNMARAAGLDVVAGKVAAGVNGRDVLLLERFDIAPCGHRRHLVTVNALLKEESTQRDSGLSFCYEDVADLLRRHSVAINADLEQLARLALFNRAINNTDDHSRNFSLIHDGDGYRLSPAYDLVPNLAIGEYHAAGFDYLPYPPQPSEVSRSGRMFGLSRTASVSCADDVLAAIGRWRAFAEQAGIVEAEADLIAGRFNP